MKSAAVKGGIGAALIASLVGIIPTCWQSWLDHKREMMAIEQSRAQTDIMRQCEDAGFRWWRGGCVNENGDEVMIVYRGGD